MAEKIDYVICSNCLKEYREAKRTEIAYRTGLDSWEYKEPMHTKSDVISHSICPEHVKLEMEKLDRTCPEK